MNTANHATITRAVDVLDRAAPEYLRLIKRHRDATRWIDVVFEDQSEDARTHLKEQWDDKDGRFDEFYLNLDEHNQRAMLEFFSIPVEPDPYPDSAARIQAQMNGASPWDCHPFETYTLFAFLRFAYNNSLERVKELPNGSRFLEAIGTDRRGNGKNWGEFYQGLLSLREDALRLAIVEMIMESE